MGIQGVREALRTEPFQPFIIRRADGRAVPVHHPEFLALGKRRIVVIDEDDGWSFVEPLRIVSLDQMKQPPRGGNGKKRR